MRELCGGGWSSSYKSSSSCGDLTHARGRSRAADSAHAIHGNNNNVKANRPETRLCANPYAKSRFEKPIFPRPEGRNESSSPPQNDNSDNDNDNNNV